MEQFDSSVEESSKVSEQQQRNDEQQCPSCAVELREASVWMILWTMIQKDFHGVVQWKSRREGRMLSYIKSNCHKNIRLLEAS